MRANILTTAAVAVLLTGCLPAAGTSETEILADGTARTSLTLAPSLPEDGRPRSVQDLRTDAEVLSTALAAAAEDPGLCSRLRTVSSQFQVEFTTTTLTCSGQVVAGGETFRPDAATAAADLWDARRILASYAAEAASAGYGAVPDPALVAEQELEGLEEGCASGDSQACASLYERSPEGSWSEVIALLGLRDDLVGAAPAGWRSLPLMVTQQVTVPTVVQDHNGEVSEDSRTVSWQFQVEDPEEVPTNLFVSWQPVQTVSEDSGGLGGAALALLGMGAAAALYGMLWGARKFAAARKDQEKKVPVKRLSKPKKRKKL